MRGEAVAVQEDRNEGLAVRTALPGRLRSLLMDGRDPILLLGAGASITSGIAARRNNRRKRFVTVTGCGPERWRDRTEFHATATASCHRAAASALKMRRVDRETRCR